VIAWFFCGVLIKAIESPISTSMSWMGNTPTLALMLLASGALCAQEYSFRSFGITEGLNNLGVLQIYQDRVGFLWVSTENGTYRFDGDHFEAFGLAQGIPVSPATAFGDAPDGSLLVGGAIGLYHLQGNRFEKLQGDFKTISWAQGIQADGKGTRFSARTPDLWNLLPNRGRRASRHVPLPSRLVPPMQAPTAY
jgi:Two component regulator propeller